MIRTWLLAAAGAAALFTAVCAQGINRNRLTFNRYHDSRETADALRRIARRYPGLVKLSVIGKSGLGKDIQLVTVTEFATGKPEEKPGIYVEGNLHGNERIGGEAALYLIHQLVTRAKQDPKIDDLLRTRVFYVVPKANPDAADAWVRGILNPDDEDDDGRDDEDGPEDVDGNGLVTSMRIFDPEGRFIPDQEDDRLMVRFNSLSVKERKRYRGPRYRVMQEGIDNDDDGVVNEDGPDWDIDPNRDFPFDTKMERKYRKKYARGGNTRTRGRPSKVRRGKKEPEPEFLRCLEVQAIVKFLDSHPSIGLAVSFHSYGNVLFRSFGYMPDRPTIPKDDLKRLDELGRTFARHTGFRGYGPPYLGERQVVGGLHDYTYWSLGYPGVTVEIWGVPGVTRDWEDRGRRNRDRARDRRRRGTPSTYRKMLDYIDQENIEDACFAWSPFDHPTLGDVEIGGMWLPGRLRYNPPPSRIKSTLEPFVQFTLEAARMTPLVRVFNVEVKTSKTRVRGLRVEVINLGNAPTAWRLAEKRNLAESTRVQISLPPGMRLSSGRLERDLGVLKEGQSSVVRWNVVLPEGPDPQTVTVKVVSQKGGTHRREVVLDPHVEIQ